MTEETLQINTQGGDFVNRDKIVHNITHIIQQTISAVEEAEKVRSIGQQRLAEGVRDYAQRLRAITAVGRNANEEEPYKGLLAYHLSDAELFFGRHQAITDLWRCLQLGPLTVLHSESGVGKSSLLQAGISPWLLAQGHLPVYLRPYSLPPGLAIKRAFIPNLDATPELAQTSLRDFLHRATSMLSLKTTLYLLLDQFEEVFTLLSEADQTGFANDLADCLKDPTLLVRWVLAVRSEFFSDLASFQPQIQNPFENQYRLHRLTEVEARQVIVTPAARHGIDFEPTLVEALLADLRDEKSKLLSPPQIQLVCSALYNLLLNQQRQASDQPSVITLSLYETENRIEGILHGYLNQVLRDNLPTKQERDLARRVLIALVSSDQHRQRLSRSELAKPLAVGISAAQDFDHLLEQLVTSRLLTVEKDEQTDEFSYELAHDYLLAEIKFSPEEQTRKAAEELLKQEVESYERHGTLLSADKFNIIDSQRKFLALGEKAKELLHLSHEALEQETKEKKAQRQRELEQQRALAEAQRQRAEEQASAAKRLRWLSRGLAIFLLLALAAAYFAFEQSSIATARQLSAQSQLALNRNEIKLAAILALEAQEFDQHEAWDTLSQIPYKTGYMKGTTLIGHESRIKSVAWDPQGHYLASGSDDGSIIIWDTQTGQKLISLPSNADSVESVAWDPLSNRLASGSNDGVIIWDTETWQPLITLHGPLPVQSIAWEPQGHRLALGLGEGAIIIWDAETQQTLTILHGHTTPIWSVAWDPQAHRLASGSDDGSIIIWDTKTWQQLISLHGYTTPVWNVTWDPQGYRLAGGTDGDTIIWDSNTWQQLTSFKKVSTQVAWDPKGRYLAAGTGQGIIMIWDTKTDQQLTTLSGHTRRIRSVAWDPQGHYLASGSDDGSIIIWDTETRQQPRILTTQTSVLSVAWDTKGDRLATGGDNGSIIIWDTQTGQGVATLHGHKDWVTSMTWDPSDHRLASGSRDNKIIIWDTQTWQLLTILTDHIAPVTSVAWAPQGHRLISAAEDGTIIVWDTQTWQSLATLPNHSAAVLSVAWDSQAHRLASGADNGTIIIWDTKTWQPLNHLHVNKGSIFSLAWDLQGRLASGVGDRGEIIIWDSKTWQPLAILHNHTSRVWGLAWNLKDSRLASGSWDYKIIIWDTTTWQPLTILSDSPTSIWRLAWDPQGHYLAAGAENGNIYLIPDIFMQAPCQWLQGRDLDLTEWTNYVGYYTLYKPPCSNLVTSPSFFYPSINYFLFTSPGRLIILGVFVLVVLVISISVWICSKAIRWGHRKIFR